MGHFRFFFMFTQHNLRFDVLVAQNSKTFPIRNIITISLWLLYTFFTLAKAILSVYLHLPHIYHTFTTHLPHIYHTFTTHFQKKFKINFLYTHSLCKNSRENNVLTLFLFFYNYWRVKSWGVFLLQRES